MVEPLGAQDAASIAPLQAALLQDPIAFLSAEHARQTVLLRHLERLARAPQGCNAKVLAGAVTVWLAAEVPMHLADEEGSLYPRLRAFDTKQVVARLAADHVRDCESVARLAPSLRRMKGRKPERGFPALALNFGAEHRRHLALEEAALMPLVRRALSAQTIAVLAGEMARRRSGRARPHA